METTISNLTKNMLKGNHGGMRTKVARIIFAFFATAYVALQTINWVTFPDAHEAADRLVDSSIAQIIGRNYDDSRRLTREEVILIISDVFLHLKQPNFKKREDSNATIGQALILKILKGDEKGYRIKDEATKEESLAFIGRSLDIPTYPGTESDSLGEIDSAEWAIEPIQRLIEQGCSDEICELGDLRQAITVSGLKLVLSKVVEVKIKNISFLRDVFLQNPISYIIVVVGTIIFAVIPAKKTLFDKDHSQRGEDQKQREEEPRWQGEEQKRQEEELKRQEEELKRQEEELKRREEELKRREEELKRQEEEQKRQEEEQKRQEEEQKRQEEELKRQEEERKDGKESGKGRKKGGKDRKKDGKKGRKDRS